MLTRGNILTALCGVKDERGASLITPDMISGLVIREGGKVGFIITLVSPGPDRQWLEEACRHAVLALPGVAEVTVVLTSESRVASRESGAERDSDRATRIAPARSAIWNKEPIPHVKRLIAVASGKGGVGKSTTAVNLAHALKASGLRVGLLDADIYGPSIPRMMGLAGAPEVKEGKVIPPLGHGIPAMSMGLLVGEESALVWRGPQMSKALAQLLRGVAWGSEAAPLDVLLIDMPPGTGDIHLSLAQQAPLSGAVIVTTPQDVAVADARKCIDMFNKVHVPILGVIENMSGFADPVTGKIHAIFGEGGGKKLAGDCGVPFLGQVPIMIALREASDGGGVFEDKTGVYKTIAVRL